MTTIGGKIVIDPALFSRLQDRINRDKQLSLVISGGEPMVRYHSNGVQISLEFLSIDESGKIFDIRLPQMKY
jgi:hypothetical protein